MFRSARIKLTLQYLAVIMAITLAFSSFVYISVNTNTKRALEGQRRRLERQVVRKGEDSQFLPMGPMIDLETLLEIRSNTLTNLIFINLLVLVLSGSLGYILAGKTLKPIEVMMKKQKRFISDAAHEIKTPLTAMKTTLEVTIRDKKLNLDMAMEALKSTVEEVDKLHGFTSGLLKQSKYQGENNIHKEEIILGELIGEVVKKMDPLAYKRDQKLVSSVEQVKVIGNKEELEELITNLIDNAIKYNKDGGLVNMELKKIGDHAIMSVKDQGIGISQEDLKNIFEPFYRSDKSRTKSNQEGYGLGLAITKEIVERHEGKIFVESVINSGSTFTVKLPISSQ